MNTKIVAIALASLALLGLSACSKTASTSAPTVTVTKDSVTEDLGGSTLSDPDQLMSLLDNAGLGYVDSGTAVELAQSICQGLRNGIGWQTIVKIGESSGFTQTQSISLVAASIVVYCPEQQSKI